MASVLLVDDDIQLLQIAQQFLIQEEPTIKLVGAISAREALQKLKEESFDVLVSDYQMSEMDGLELLQTLREGGNEIPFIMFTGRGREEVAMQALNLGADYYIMKGGEPKSMYGELAHIIRQLVQFKQTEEELLRSEEKVKEHSERLETILDNVPAIIFSKDANNRFVEVNKAIADAHNVTKEELAGKSLFDLYPHEQAQAYWDDDLEVIRSGQAKLRFEEPWDTPEGRQWVITSKIPLKNKIGEVIGVLGFSTDITDRKQVEKQLQDNIERLQSFMDSATDGFAIFDSVMRILEINKVGLGMIPGGIKKEDLLGKSLPELMPGTEKTKVYNKYLEVLRNGKSFIVDEQSNEPIFGDMVFTVKGFKVGEGVGTVVTDISDRKRAENELQESMERLQSFMDSATESFTIFDSEMRYLDINQAGLEMWPEGTRKEDLIGKSLPELIPGVEKSEPYDKYLEVIRSGTPFVVEGQTSYAPFRDKYFEVKGFRVGDGLGLVSADITEQKRMLEKLRESEENYRNLTNLHFDGVAIHEAGIFRDLNPAGAKMFGYSHEELIGANIFQVIHPESHEIARQSMAKGLDIPFEVVGIKKDGQPVHVELVVGNCTYQGKPARIAAFRDMTEQKQAEEQINYLAELVENVSDALISSDSNHTIKSWNQAAEKIYGWQAVEVIGKPIKEVLQGRFPGKSREEVIQDFEDTGSWKGEVIHTKKDGSTIWMLEATSAIKNSKGEIIGIVSINRDISERKRTEHALIERIKELNCLYGIAQIVERPDASLEEILQDIVELVPTAWVYSKIACGRIILKDQSFITERFLVSPWTQVAEIIVHGQNVGQVEVFYSEERPSIVGGEGPFLKEERFLIDSIAGQIGKIMEQKQAEKALRESEEKYRHLFEHANDSIFISDPVTRHLLDVNENAARKLGYTKDELLQLKVGDTHLPMDEDRRKTLRKELDETGSVIFERYHRKKDGSGLPVEVSLRYVEYGGKKVIQSFSRDITERKKAENLLIRQKEELSGFALTMAHDLRNQLYMIEGFADLLKNEYNPEDAERIHKLARKSQALLDRSVELADAGLILKKTDTINLTDLVKAIAMTHILKDIVFETDQLPKVLCDRLKVGQIFQNLFENAITHGKPQKIEVRKKDASNGTHILITNDGEPIHPENQSKIFDHRFTTKEGRFGMGLDIVQKLVNAHGWQISLEDTPKTTFTIFIPN